MKRTEIFTINGVTPELPIQKNTIPVSPVDKAIGDLLNAMSGIQNTVDKMVDLYKEIADFQNKLIENIQNNYNRIEDVDIALSELELQLVERGLTDRTHDDIDIADLEYRKWVRAEEI